MSSPLLNYLIATPNPTEDGLRERGFTSGMKSGWLKKAAQLCGVSHCELKSLRAAGIPNGGDWRSLNPPDYSGYHPPKGNEELWECAKEIPVTTYTERNSVLHAMGFPTYEKYLASPLWSKIRSRVFSEIGSACKVCQGVGNQVHHVDYTWQNLSGTLLDGMIPICGDCHTSIEMDGKRKRSLMEAKNIYKRQHKPIKKKKPAFVYTPNQKAPTTGEMMARIIDLEEAVATLLNRINGL